MTCCALSAGFVRPARARSQQSSPATIPAPQSKLKVSVDLVKADVSIMDRRGNFVEGLQKENFRVFDDGVEQPVTFFAATDAPAQILVLVETSPAVFLIHRQHLEAAYALLSGLAPDDEVALATYADQPRLVLPFTADKNPLAQSLLGIQYELGSTELNFYDAVSSCIDWLNTLAGKKALLLLTTGLDPSPSGHWEALADRIRSSDVIVFSVALGGSFRSYDAGPSIIPGGSSAATPGLSFQAADRTLQALADLSGGQTFFPKDDKKFASIYRRIAAALRHEYVLGFVPAHDGGFHALTFEILDAKGQPLPLNGSKKSLHLFARQGYHAPGPAN
ncbi:MAG TPA: VWA domain-containing protein [Candidatus Acidoferrales bacterium]|nr:VWA domain-containing protein [Candidatus Acidoferrales bacterium]